MDNLTDDKAQQLVKEIRELEQTTGVLRSKQERLATLRGQCSHKWSTAERKSERHEGYTIPADGAGSDWRPACHVSPKTDVWWERRCSKCGLTQKTEQCRPTASEPVFPS